jgi:asparagine synthase (glutamine-hydrolysing)
MCGIAGIYTHSGHLQEPEVLLTKMLTRIHYRGPDESGIYINSQVALGSVRLSIIDIKTGQQPFSSSDGKYWIVFNGEIFNYIELKNELRLLGYSFRTESDTEVLLTAFIAYGKDCLNRLNGQFAFAIWNNEKKELFIARDRVGIRPLFYTQTDSCFIFGSEIKTLFEHPDVRSEFDPFSLAQVFTFWTTITPATLFINIYELPPGHYMWIKDSKAVPEPEKYWTLRFPENNNGQFEVSFEDAKAELQKILTDAVKINSMRPLISRKYQNTLLHIILLSPAHGRILATISLRWYGMPKYLYYALLPYLCSVYQKKSGKTILK